MVVVVQRLNIRKSGDIEIEKNTLFTRAFSHNDVFFRMLESC